MFFYHLLQNLCHIIIPQKPSSVVIALTTMGVIGLVRKWKPFPPINARIVSILLPIVLFFTFFMEINQSRLSCFLHIVLILCMKTVSSEPHVHIVGNSIWSIPPSNDFYIDWSSNRSFFVGDDLVFRFDTGLSDVMQVSSREYESCSAENPFRRFEVGPANVPLVEAGMHYFICSFGNYCVLGQKFSAQVLHPSR